MRELCRAGGTVVAAVVAVLEKQQQALSAPPKPPPKNSTVDDESFQLAMKDFDSVAEDVERIVARTRNQTEESSSDDDSSDDTSESGEHVVDQLETIAEEERNTSSALSYKGWCIFGGDEQRSVLDVGFIGPHVGHVSVHTRDSQ